VRSEVGRGTTFAFEVKLKAAASTEALRQERRVIGLEPDQETIRVLVVDDKPENRALLVKLLASVGLDVRDAANGREAFEVWEAWRPHLIWMDIRMPVMDGYEATRRIRQAESVVGSPLPVAGSDSRADGGPSGSRGSDNRLPATDNRPCTIIALTASAFEHDRDAVIEAGCDDFLAKPFRESSVFDLMGEHLGLRFQFYEPPPPAPRNDGERATVAMSLALLPADFRAKLNEAVVQGDIGLAFGLIDDIHAHDEALATELRTMLKEYRLDDLIELIERA